MRIKATVIVSLKLMLTQWKQIILMYAIFPLSLALVMGYFQKDVFKPNINMEKIKISIYDEDDSKSSHNFTELFSFREFKQLFELSDSGDYIITIPKDFEDNLKELKEVTIQVDEKKRINRINEAIIRSIISEYGRGISQAMIISDKIESLDIKDKESFYSEIAAKISSVEAVSAIKDNILKGEESLNSYENQGATMITFFAIIIAMGCVAGYHLDKENGSFKRLMSTPISRLSFFNLDMLIFLIASFIYGLIYILAFRIAGFAFIGVNPAIIISILVVQSLVISALAGLLVAFIGKNNSNLIMIFIMYFQILFGGIFIPVKEVNNEVFAAISKFAPGNLISETYRRSMLYNSFDKIAENLLSMFIFAIVLYFISIIKVKVRWEE
jgi:ABC-2 type transport system permease protein